MGWKIIYFGKLELLVEVPTFVVGLLKNQHESQFLQSVFQKKSNPTLLLSIFLDKSKCFQSESQRFSTNIKIKRFPLENPLNPENLNKSHSGEVQGQVPQNKTLTGKAVAAQVTASVVVSTRNNKKTYETRDTKIVCCLRKFSGFRKLWMKQRMAECLQFKFLGVFRSKILGKLSILRFSQQFRCFSLTQIFQSIALSGKYKREGNFPRVSIIIKLNRRKNLKI